METDIVDALTDLGYNGPLLDENLLEKALENAPKSVEYTKVIHTLAEELKQLCNLEETVNAIKDSSESSAFLIELSSFLKELGCPYTKLVMGHLSSRIQNREDAMLLLGYLIAELMSARMVNVDKPKEGNALNIVVQESPTAKDLKDILISLKLNKPPPNITVEMLFAKIEAKLKDMIASEGQQLVGKPLYNKSTTEKQWKELEMSYAEMLEDYGLRRETLITRLECTIQSFEWSDRLKNKRDEIQAAYRPKRAPLRSKPDVKLSDFLAARTDLLQVEKTASASVTKNTQSEVNKVIIGKVPDRGGRPNDQQPPPPEMPSWQQRTTQGGGGGRGGGRGGERGGRGGRGDWGGRGGDRGGRGGDWGGRGGDRGGRGGRGGGRVQGGYSQATGGDQRPQSTPAPFNDQSQRNYSFQTFEVPAGGYDNQTGYNQGGGYSQGGSYNQGVQGYRGGSNRNNNPGYDSAGSYGGYNRGYNRGGNTGYNRGGETGYNRNSGGFDQNGGGGGGGYRGGYQNEHDDRDRRGRSNYNRGGRR